ncbi:HAD-IA family hydrolase, partial [Streptomyces sp. NPDC059697]|uniref:HAD-IA family hydrolase n=1 Tax=Streptomyces sp. NPDC059697 TaxID=3346912 RepID=UPI0036854F28
PPPSDNTAAAPVAAGTPSPPHNLLAAPRLGAAPQDCLVVEDAPSGVRSGLRAGMTVWGVNAPVVVDGVHRHFGSLREAINDILAVASGTRPHGPRGSAAAR